jgi:hypothetical protein
VALPAARTQDHRTERIFHSNFETEYAECPLRGQSVQVQTLSESSSDPAREFTMHTTWALEAEIRQPLANMQRLAGYEYSPIWIGETQEKLWLREPGFSLYLDLEMREGQAQLSKPRQWQDVLRALSFHDYLSQGGLLLHAAAVAREGIAYIFPGLSGAGKTTIVRRSAGMTIFNDEIAADYQLTIQPTPS